MNFYWLYDIPTWTLFALIIGSICTVAATGCLLLRNRMEMWLSLDHGQRVVLYCRNGQPLSRRAECTARTLQAYIQPLDGRRFESVLRV
jgi:hypothetical protein